ncbi:V-type ATP synthase subunit E family protein [Clostridium sp. BJN0001]|uniref:V-type ATP synthase subunit E n=1 Tax=Clostridium sp. BJN0001 TaxID=2930219 RepID=UPI001FD015C9|nr:V-type ATP synthase subunit E family protein [Clostridium sp. BJN0001]
MSNIKNLTSKIINDSEEKKANILKDANEQKSKILSKKNDEALKAKEAVIEKSKVEAASRKERIISSAELKARNNKLEAKQHVIDEVFLKSVEELSNLSDEDFKSFVKETIKNTAIDGDEKIILNNEGKKIITKDVLNELNTELGQKGNLTISDETSDFKGGFILEKNGIEINNTFEALVDSLRDELEFEVAKVLFN